MRIKITNMSGNSFRYCVTQDDGWAICSYGTVGEDIELGTTESEVTEEERAEDRRVESAVDLMREEASV